MTLDYSHEKAHQILLTLGTMDASLVERIEAACVHPFLALAEGRTGGLSDSLVGAFAALLEEMSSVEPSGGEGSTHATLMSVDESTVQSFAERMVDLCIEVLQVDGPEVTKLVELREE